MNSIEEKIQKDLELLCEKTKTPFVDFQKVKSTFRKRAKIKRNILFAAIFIIIFNVGIIANAEPVRRIFTQLFTTGFADKRFEGLPESEINSYTDIKTTENNLQLEVVRVVSDTLRTVIQLKATGSPLSGIGILQLEGGNDIGLIDESGKSYRLENVSAGSYTEGIEYTYDVCPVIFAGGPTEKCEMTLYVRKMNGVSGNWNLTFEVDPNLEAKHFKINETYKFKNGTELTATDVTCYLTQTVLKGEYNNYIEDYYVDRESPPKRPSAINNVILYVDGKKYEESGHGSNEADFVINFDPDIIDSESKIELEFQMDYIRNENGNGFHPDYANSLKKQIYLIPDMNE